jgi:hypothetical protein
LNELTIAPVGLTHVADLTNEEYQKIYLGTHFDGTERLANAPAFTLTGPLADTINWVNKGAVTRMYNLCIFISLTHV